MLTLNHKSLDVWKLSVKIIKNIYTITEKFPINEKFGLISQLRRASVSVASNIAEGSSRKSPAERKRFYEIARSSLVEVDTQLEVSIILNFVHKEELLDFEVELIIAFKMLTSLIKNTN